MNAPMNLNVDGWGVAKKASAKAIRAPDASILSMDLVDHKHIKVINRDSSFKSAECRELIDLYCLPGLKVLAAHFRMRAPDDL